MHGSERSQTVCTAAQGRNFVKGRGIALAEVKGEL